jgi:xylan 1,4-beta-xylosidase
MGMAPRRLIVLAGLLALAVAATAAATGCGASGGDDGAARPGGQAPPPIPAPPSPGGGERVPNTAGGAPAFRNPVIAADFPDPTVIRFGTGYWATATNHGTAQPVFQLLHSPDLVNWSIVGSVFPRPVAWATESWWAPHLVRWKDKVLLYYSAKRRGRKGRCIGVAEARTPAGPWADRGPVLCKPGAPLDPTTVVAGRRLYLVYKAAAAIRARRLSPNGLRIAGSEKILLTAPQPWERGLVEAPELIRDGRTWVLLYSGAACCGKRCTYAIGAARSRSPLGPYTKRRTNPIIDSSSTWRCPGHVGAVRDERGDQWLLYHAYPRRGFGYVGRQTLLDRVRWRGGWPKIGEAGHPSTAERAPFDSQRRAQVWGDDFSASTLAASWQWQEGRRPGIRLRSGKLDLAPPPSDRGKRGRLLFLTVPEPAYRAETLLSEGNGGIGVFWGSLPGAWVEREGGALVAFSTARARRPKQIGRLAVGSEPVVLRVSARYNRFRFEASTNGSTWRAVGPSYDAPAIPGWAFGTSVALIAEGPARFDWIRLRAGS